MNHFYDGIDHRYSSSDAEQSRAIRILTNVLGFRPSLDGLEYSMGLYAGGTGVDDNLAVRFRAEPSTWSMLSEKLRLKSPVEAAESSDWSEDFEWLVCGDRPTNDITTDARMFIDARKSPFQDAGNASEIIAFSEESNVNTWCVVWMVNGWANYLAFDQG